MLKFDKENNKLIETDERIHHKDEHLEILTKLFKEVGFFDEERAKRIREIRNEKKEKYSE